MKIIKHLAALLLLSFMLAGPTPVQAERRFIDEYNYEAGWEMRPVGNYDPVNYENRWYVCFHYDDPCEPSSWIYSSVTEANSYTHLQVMNGSGIWVDIAGSGGNMCDYNLPSPGYYNPFGPTFANYDWRYGHEEEWVDDTTSGDDLYYFDCVPVVGHYEDMEFVPATGGTLEFIEDEPYWRYGHWAIVMP